MKLKWQVNTESIEATKALQEKPYRHEAAAGNPVLTQSRLTNNDRHNWLIQKWNENDGYRQN